MRYDAVCIRAVLWSAKTCAVSGCFYRLNRLQSQLTQKAQAQEMPPVHLSHLGHQGANFVICPLDFSFSFIFFIPFILIFLFHHLLLSFCDAMSAHVSYRYSPWPFRFSQTSSDQATRVSRVSSFRPCRSFVKQLQQFRAWGRTRAWPGHDKGMTSRFVIYQYLSLNHGIDMHRHASTRWSRCLKLAASF